MGAKRALMGHGSLIGMKTGLEREDKGQGCGGRRGWIALRAPREKRRRQERKEAR